ncbi:MAG: PD-(D/E)XK nuclease family transposase [Desulfitobacteriaceae bacterium]
MLAAFLNAILKPPAGKQIQSLSYTNPELSKDNADDKESSLDIRVVTEDQRQINIEIQLKNEHNIQDILVRWLFLLDGNEDEEIRRQLEVIAVEARKLSILLRE